MSRELTIIAALVLMLGGCSAASGGSERCDAAFRNTEPRAAPPYGASPLDDAIRQCDSVVLWRSAWERIPGAHDGRDNPMTFLLQRCEDPKLAATTLCREVAPPA